MFRLLASTAPWLPVAFVLDGLGALLLPVRLARDLAPDGLATATGALSAAGLLATLVALPLAAAASDRARRRVGRIGTVVLAAGGVLAALAVVAVAADAATFAVAWIALHGATGALIAATSPLVPEFVPAARRGLAAGVKGFVDLAGSFAAFLALGALLAGGDTAAPLALTALVVVVAVALSAAGLRAAVDGGPVAAGPRDVTRGAAAAGHLSIAASRFLFLLGIYLIGRFLVVIVAARLGIDPQRAADEAGGLLAALALGAAVAAVPAGWAADRWGRVPVTLAGAASGVSGALLIAAVGGLVGIAAGGVFLALASGMFATGNWAQATDAVSPAAAGRGLWLVNAATIGAAAAAGAGGPLYDAATAFGPGFGVTALALAAAAAMAAGGVLAARGTLVARPTGAMEVSR